MLTVQKLLENAAGIFRYLVEQLFSQFSRSGLWVADNAEIGNKLLARRPWPRYGLVEHGRPHCVSDEIDLLGDLVATNQVWCNRKHYRCLVFPPVDFGNGRVARFCPRSGVRRTNIEAEVGAQILRQCFQNSPVSAVTIDDGEMARRKTARNLAPEVAHESGHSLYRKRQRPGRPLVFARKAHCQRRQLPQIICRGPSADDTASEFFRQDDIGIKRQMRAMLLDRPIGKQRIEVGRRRCETS